LTKKLQILINMILILDLRCRLIFKILMQWLITKIKTMKNSVRFPLSTKYPLRVNLRNYPWLIHVHARWQGKRVTELLQKPCKLNSQKERFFIQMLKVMINNFMIMMPKIRLMLKMIILKIKHQIMSEQAIYLNKTFLIV